MANLFRELRRRNVFRVAALYIVVSWLILQVLDVVTDFLPLPEWTRQLVFLLLALGFLLAIIFAWAYEITPEGLKRDRDVLPAESIAHTTGRRLNILIVAGLVVALAYFAATHDWRPDAAPAAPVEPERQSVAVLPFANMSDDPANEYFSDGIAEEILNALVAVDGLRVTSRTSSFAFKNRELDLPTIARELKVGHVLEGSVRKAGNRVRITAQLIDVATDSHLWSQTYERDFSDIFAIQKDISTSIAKALELTLTTGKGQALDPASPPTRDLEAYEAYLQARYLVHNRGRFLAEGLAQARDLFQRAVELDPGFAAAWAGLGAVHALYPGYAGTDLEDAAGLAEAAIERALELDPRLGEAHASLGMLRLNQARWLEAAGHLEKAIEVDPQYETAYVWYGILLTVTGRSGRALEVLLTASDKDPASAIGAHWLADIHRNLGQWERSLQAAERSLQLGMRMSVMGVYIYHLEKGDIDQAELVLRAQADAFGAPASYVEPLIAALREPAREPEFHAEVQRLLVDNPGFFYGWMYFDLTDIDRLVEVLEDHSERGDLAAVMYRAWEPGQSALRAHPRFVRLMQDVGIVDFWRQAGWPDLCQRSTESLECD